jgi:putative holliday junction resolvase
MGRILAIDWGEKRIGLALSDEGQVIASPHAVLPRGRSRADDLSAIARVVEEREVERVVMGIPIRTDGSRGPEAEKVEAAAARLRAVLAVPVDTIDERFSSAEARRALTEGEVSSRKQRGKVDAIAASLFLQTWMERRRRGGSGPGDGA